MTKIKKRLLAEQSLLEAIEQVPFNIAIIDRDYRMVDANENFKEYFGSWEGKHCYEVYKGLDDPCPNCQAKETFQDGMVRVADESGHDRHGRICHYVVHLAPLRDKKGNIPYVVEMSTDLTATRQWQRKYNLLFERVPCYIAIIDRDYRIIRANEKFRKAFGESTGEYCYQVYKRRNSPCPECPAADSFRDGKEHIATQVGLLHDGSVAHYIMSTAPLAKQSDGNAHVIEIATDITHVVNLEDELHEAHDLYKSLIQNQASGIVVLDEEGQVKLTNPASCEMFECETSTLMEIDQLQKMLPASFFNEQEENVTDVSAWNENTIRNIRGEEIPVLFRTVKLTSRNKKLGRVAFIRDLRQIKALEKEKLDAERLAAVGQTVAGLAHTIKNLLMGLEGGMYMVDSGMRKGNAERIAEGWEVLQTNFEKTTTLVKDFLSFAKGRLPDLKWTDPNLLTNTIYDLYRDTASQQGVKLVLDLKQGIDPVFLDPEGIEASLTNLLSNGIDAVILAGNDDGQVVLCTRDDGEDLIFEVKDNGCGMDWDIKQKIFTTFFTTKGGEGTGLGLLTTRKIIQEHFGKIEVDTVEGVGTTFRVRLPRRRLKELAETIKADNDKGDSQ